MEKIQEIHLDEVFDRSAQEQIAAIQKRLSTALEEVKNAVNEQRKAMTLPVLPSAPKREPLAAAALAATLPDLQEKRPIDINFKRHYSETLKIVVPDPLPQAIDEANLLPQDAAADRREEISDNLQRREENAMGQSSENSEVRPLKAIAEDIEKMRSDANNKSSFTPVSAAEKAPSPVVNTDGAMPKTSRKASIIRSNGIVISALKSKIQRAKGKQLAVTEPMETDENHRQDSVVNAFTGMTLPNLPFSGKVLSDINDSQANENKPKTLMAHRRQIGPHRFHL
jgi:hypothetical protein